MPIEQPAEQPTGSARARSATGVATEESSSEGITETHDDHADAESVARTIALRRLTTRAHTRHELDKALQAKNVPQERKGCGSRPDAKRWVWLTMQPSQSTGSPPGSSGATSPVARSSENWKSRESSAAISTGHLSMSTAMPKLASARELVERKRAAMSALPRDVQQRRLAGMLSRRGFDSAVITRVLSDVLRE